MIVTFPNMPDMGKGSHELKLPRPAVFLIGSYGPASRWRWRAKAAKLLDRHVGCVFYGDPSSAVAVELYVQWMLDWLHAADVVGFYVEGEHPTNDFELGLSVGWQKPLVLGTSVAEMVRPLSAMAEALRLPALVRDNVEDFCAAIEAAARGD